VITTGVPGKKAAMKKTVYLSVILAAPASKSYGYREAVKEFRNPGIHGAIRGGHDGQPGRR
jgi:hypothetical protein